MKIEEAFARYLGQEVLVYTVSQGGKWFLIKGDEK